MVDTAVGIRHVWTMGTGPPTVVVVTCLGGPCTEWVHVARELADDASVVLYDRAGLGWSPPAGRRRSIGDMVDELHAVLKGTEIPGPYVLVGHSTGGLVARLFASRHPEDVVGLVLVDSSHERMDDHLEQYDPTPWYFPHRRWERSIRDRLRWLGVTRLLHDLGRGRDRRSTSPGGVPADLLDAAIALALSTADHRASSAELAGLPRGFDEVAAGARHLGHLPLTVITGGPLPTAARARWWNPGWLELQAELVAQSNRSRQVRADHIGHHVHRDDPDLVVRSIREDLSALDS